MSLALAVKEYPESSYFEISNYKQNEAVGKEGQFIQAAERDALFHYFDNSKYYFDGIIEMLIKIWLSQTIFLSSTTEIINNRAFKRIVSFGTLAIPQIISNLKTQPSFLFYALHLITGENPVHTDHVGDIERMTNDWLEWARGKDYNG